MDFATIPTGDTTLCAGWKGLSYDITRAEAIKALPETLEEGKAEQYTSEKEGSFDGNYVSVVDGVTDESKVLTLKDSMSIVSKTTFRNKAVVSKVAYTWGDYTPHSS